MFQTANRLKEVGSAVRGPLYYKALEMEKQGVEVLKLNTGNPATFGFAMPDSIRDALAGGLDAAVAYSDFRGMPAAREAICAYHQSRGIRGVSPDDVYIGNGVSELVELLMLGVMNAGDEILMPAPCYSLWSNSARIADAKPVFYRCDEDNDWLPNLDNIRSLVTDRTRAIVLINPNNPTGTIYPRKTIEEIVALAEEKGLMIFSDEIYDRLLMEGCECVSAAAVAETVPVVTFNGLSKSHYICGFRCGWMLVSGPSEATAPLHEVIIKLTSMRLCSNAPAQMVIPSALRDPDTIRRQMMPGGRLYEQSKACVEEINKIDGLSVVPNKAAFYVFPKIDLTMYAIDNDKDFAGALLEKKHILLVPGSGFQWPEPDHFRLVMLPQPDELAAAMRALGELLQEYRR